MSIEQHMRRLEAVQSGIDENNADAVMRLAVGHIFRLASRPEQPGDIEKYESARRVILCCSEVLRRPA